MKKVWGIATAIGFFLLLGTVGAMECETIEFGRGCLRIVIFLAATIFTTHKAGWFMEVE